MDQHLQTLLPPSVRSSSAPSPSGARTPLRGQDLFGSSVFRTAETTALFYRSIAILRQKIHTDVREISRAHRFLRVLRDVGRLTRCYTQNIDALEAREGL